MPIVAPSCCEGTARHCCPSWHHMLPPIASLSHCVGEGRAGAWAWMPVVAPSHRPLLLPIVVPCAAAHRVTTRHVTACVCACGRRCLSWCCHTVHNACHIAWAVAEHMGGGTGMSPCHGGLVLGCQTCKQSVKCERMEMEMRLTRAAHARVLPCHEEGRGTGMWDLHTEVVSKKEKNTTYR